jgi:hypothetical protein
MIGTDFRQVFRGDFAEGVPGGTGVPSGAHVTPKDLRIEMCKNRSISLRPPFRLKWLVLSLGSPLTAPEPTGNKRLRRTP